MVNFPVMYAEWLLSPEGLDVHVLVLLLAQTVFDEVLPLAGLAGEHVLPHGVGGGALTPGQVPVDAVKARPEAAVGGRTEERH